MRRYIEVKEMIDIFKDMAERETLLAGRAVTQMDLLMQIAGAISVVAMRDEKEGYGIEIPVANDCAIVASKELSEEGVDGLSISFKSSYGDYYEIVKIEPKKKDNEEIVDIYTYGDDGSDDFTHKETIDVKKLNAVFSGY